MITDDGCFRLLSGRNGFEKASDLLHQSFTWIPKLWRISLSLTNYARVQQVEKNPTIRMKNPRLQQSLEQTLLSLTKVQSTMSVREATTHSPVQHPIPYHTRHTKKKCLLPHWNLFECNMVRAPQHKPPPRPHQQIPANQCDCLPTRRGLWNSRHVLHDNKRILQEKTEQCIN
jgi:hypothetical protein